MGQNEKEKKIASMDVDKHLSKQSENSSSLNHGHRERMRKRFQKSGLDSFQPHEILELLLFYALPRVNTNPIAHELIRRFHSLSGVLDASPEELKQVKGISDNAATFLTLMPKLCQQYQLDKQVNHEALDSTEKLCEFVRLQFSCTTVEQVLLICLDESLQLLQCEMISAGTTQEVLLDVHRIVEYAIQRRSTRIVLAHNHPHAKAILSDADLFSTNQLRKILGSMHIKLLDHIVVGKQGDTVSMRQIMHWTDTP